MSNASVRAERKALLATRAEFDRHRVTLARARGQGDRLAVFGRRSRGERATARLDG